MKVAMLVNRSLNPADHQTLPSPAAVDREIHAEEVASMRELLQKHIPELAGELIHAETCMFTLTPDEHL